MKERLKIMLVDDEESIKRVVEQIIIKEDYQLYYAENGEKALQMCKKEKPDLIILDVMLPEIDGFEVCRIIRTQSNIPIIMLSAKGDIVDKSVGFNMGADDYITKPFSPIELSLRIKSLLRRTKKEVGNESEDRAPERIVHNDLEINSSRYEVKVHGTKVELTPKEFELLCLMARHPEQVFTRKQLYNTLWGEVYIGDTSTITVFIRKIREKIEKEPARPKHIVTVWGVGYKFCC